ncbi:MAG: NAD-dependent deacylase [Acidobacteriota bacterium]
MHDMIEKVRGWLRAAERVVVLTGAGVSAESGVPVFRGAGGLWRQYRPEDLATPEAFARQPALVWEWYLWRRRQIAAAVPHAGHEAIAQWQRTRPGVALLTQNVDGLHARAVGNQRSPAASTERPPPESALPSTRTIELHGNLWRVRCNAGCGYTALDSHEGPSRTNLRCPCGRWVRPDVVWFGEPLNQAALSAAIEEASLADVILVVGTSGVVYPVAALPDLVGRATSRRRGRIIEINPEQTSLGFRADAVLRGPASVVLPALDAW